MDIYWINIETGGVIMNQALIESKKAVVSEITEKLKNSESTVVVEYRGLSVKEITDLRRALREEDV